MTDQPAAQITHLLEAAGRGDRAAYDALLSAVHRELHRIAQRQMRGERAGHTLQPTVLVNEAYLRLADSNCENRAHFFGAAARCMRQILVDHARKRGTAKRGGGLERVTFVDDLAVDGMEDADLLRLDEALEALRRESTRVAQVVELRFFAGMTVEDIAGALGVGSATVKRDWRYARAWLNDHMGQPGT